MDVAALCAAIRDWTIAQIPGGAEIPRPFKGNCQIPFVAMVQEFGLGRDIIWTLRVKEPPDHIHLCGVGLHELDR